MKIFERVIKKEIMKHLTENEMFNKGRHGFVPGRSTQTQLLSHFNDIFDTLAEENNVSGTLDLWHIYHMVGVGWVCE